MINSKPRGGDENPQTWLQNSIKRYIIPFVVALIAYAAVAGAYFAPQFGGDKLVQGDVMQYDGMTQEILETRDKSGEDPKWTGSMFGGMPAYLINVAYPSQIVKKYIGSVTKIIDTPASFIIFAMLAMWLMLVMMGVNAWVAIVGGAMYGLSTYFFLIIEAGHITKMWALVYAPLMFAGAYMTLKGRNMWLGAALMSLFTSLEIGANHPQISYYFGMGMGAFWLSEAIYTFVERGQYPERLKSFGVRTLLLIFAGVVAVGSNISPLWYTFQHTADTTRGGSVLSESVAKGSEGLDLEYATAWSYGRAESLNMLIPDFMGRDSGESFSTDGAVAEVLKPYNHQQLAQQLPLYWGEQPFTGGPTYIGAVVLFLAVLGFCLTKGRQRWWILGISLLMLFLGWGRNMMWFTELMFNILPGYDKFRTVSMTLVVLEWTAPLLGTYALVKLWNMRNEEISNTKILKGLAVAVGATAGVALLLIVAGKMIFDFGDRAALTMLIDAGFPDQLATPLAQAMVDERHAFMASDAWRTIAYIVVAAAVIWLFVKAKISRGVMVAVVGIVAVVDLASVNMRFLTHDDFTAPASTKIRPTAANVEIMKDKELGYRVFNLAVSPFNDATTSYFHRSVGGYHGAKLSRYQDLIDNQLAKQNTEVLNMLNTKYFIVPTSAENPSGVVPRMGANGAAWFVDDIVEVATPREEMDMLDMISTKSTAVVQRGEVPSDIAKYEGADSLRKIELVSYLGHKLRYKYTASRPSIAIFSEIYFDKGWSAYIDGAEAPYFRADYLLRAMALPAGEHTVEWRFEAPKWGLIEAIGWICSLIIIFGLLILMIYEGRQKIKA
ncbi:MAG: hypothetical protein SNH01_01295 [Rikenellaceae bacterium]